MKAAVWISRLFDALLEAAAASALSVASVAMEAPSELLCACAGPARPRLACAEARCPAHCAAWRGLP